MARAGTCPPTGAEARTADPSKMSASARTVVGRANDPALPLEHIPDPDERGGCGADDGEEHEIERDLVQPRRVGEQRAESRGTAEATASPSA